MKGTKKSLTEEYLYLDFSHQAEGCIFPLHTSVTLFLLSYCDCKIFKVYLVLTKESADSSLLKGAVSQDIEIQITSRQELPPIVQNCRLPAVVQQPGNFCRAGLAVVLRHTIQKSYEADPSKKDILELLGFKKTCLKACAEVSQWTRLCELTIPLAVENFLSESSEQSPAIPAEILQLERKLAEPVRVANDDKLRRQKLQQQTATRAPLTKGRAKGKGHTQEASEELAASSSLELTVAFSKLRVQEEPAPASREPAHIRKAKASDLPPLEHLFAEGLFFTLADIVLLPCIHQFLVIICKKFSEKLIEFPLLASWYQRIQEVPRVKTAASKCGIQFLLLPEFLTTSNEQHPNLSEVPNVEEQSDPLFIGGPRPTLTKLMVALHACGVATDMVIEHCVNTRASFVTCPCCYGFIQNTSKFNFPKSEQFKKTLSYKEHMILCRFADQTGVQLPPQRRLIGKQCMCLVDLDRARAAEERGYSVQVISMEPESCSPKNNMIVGVPV
ncbi:Glutathione S-transferase C-terminal domain-containing protein [Tupaia chinensis]|uniref:Glutathione S-transferase C-terminal domain-containing protein n=1 Tax=Tupaia chinensis TaxID=246437 RepID=L9KMW0_TUPCH|nr:Glutathione S-transferase C-terminal domain-containing protein [Tupaia chinensis]